LLSTLKVSVRLFGWNPFPVVPPIRAVFARVGLALLVIVTVPVPPTVSWSYCVPAVVPLMSTWNSDPALNVTLLLTVKTPVLPGAAAFGPGFRMPPTWRLPPTAATLTVPVMVPVPPRVLFGFTVYALTATVAGVLASRVPLSVFTTVVPVYVLFPEIAIVPRLDFARLPLLTTAGTL